MSLSENHDSWENPGTVNPEDLRGLNRREKLEQFPVSAINKFKEEGKDELIRNLESALEDEAEEIITEELGLDDYIPPAEFIIPKSEQESPRAASMQKFFGQGPENGVYTSHNNSVLISTDYGRLNGIVENNILSTGFHELIHNDTYNRLTGAEEVLHPGLISGQIEDISPLHKSDIAVEKFDIEPKDSILDEIKKNYKISSFELANLSENARDRISELSDQYNSSKQNNTNIIEQAYEVVQDDIDVYHLNSLETQPEKEAFAWLGSMYLEGDLEGERNQLDRTFAGYEKGDEIKDELEGLLGVYDNLTEHGEMNSEEALNYILEEVQPRKFDYKASKIRESLEN